MTDQPDPAIAEAAFQRQPQLYSTLLRVVVESPCKAQEGSSMEDHDHYLGRCLQDCLDKNEAPIASHGLFVFTGYFSDNNAFTRRLCMNAGWAYIPHAERLAVYTDYGITEGMQQAIHIASHYGIPISYRQLGKNEGDDS